MRSQVEVLKALKAQRAAALVREVSMLARVPNPALGISGFPALVAGLIALYALEAYERNLAAVAAGPVWEHVPEEPHVAPPHVAEEPRPDENSEAEPCKLKCPS